MLSLKLHKPPFFSRMDKQMTCQPISRVIESELYQKIQLFCVFSSGKSILVTVNNDVFEVGINHMVLLGLDQPCTVPTKVLWQVGIANQDPSCDKKLMWSVSIQACSQPSCDILTSRPIGSCGSQAVSWVCLDLLVWCFFFAHLCNNSTSKIGDCFTYPTIVLQFHH